MDRIYKIASSYPIRAALDFEDPNKRRYSDLTIGLPDQAVMETLKRKLDAPQLKALKDFYSENKQLAQNTAGHMPELYFLLLNENKTLVAHHFGKLPVYHNGSRLLDNIFAPLNNGDIIRIGES